MPSVRRLFALAATVLITLGLGACGGKQLTRGQLEDRYVDEIVDAGIDRSVAECVITRLFGPMTDDELREFNTTGTGLTLEEMQRVGELADACGG